MLAFFLAGGTDNAPLQGIKGPVLSDSSSAEDAIVKGRSASFNTQKPQFVYRFDPFSLGKFMAQSIKTVQKQLKQFALFLVFPGAFCRRFKKIRAESTV